MYDESGPKEPPNSEFSVKTVTNERNFITKMLQHLSFGCKNNYIYTQNEVKYGEKIPDF